MGDPLASFSTPVRTWFRDTFGAPTPPQTEGWPAIQRGEHTLILAPTGSGKTLAAFLWGIDRIYTAADAPEVTGVSLLYVSPLKALNNDIERNLAAPLAGISAVARRLDLPLPDLRVAVRTGDTPQHVRAGMVKKPPHILITTPESLYLMLTSPRAREMFRSVQTVIVDEIHTLCGDKRGVHLALSLERLQQVAGRPVQRIGLSATIKPLDEVAHFLGGQQWATGGAPAGAPGLHEDAEPAQLVPRPVTIIDSGYQKPLSLRVITPVADFRNLPGDSIWPALIPRVLHDILTHRSTLIFTNNRRLAERTADRLNAQIEAEQAEEIEPGSTEALAPGGVMRDRGMFAIGAEGPIRAHHGSMAKERRRALEEDLKAGRLAALVGTSSLELGIDIGAVDLVVQLQSPKSVAQGLQRVGRSGHMVGQTSTGHIYATFRDDLLEAAAVARGMLEGDVEETHTPQNPLDVLAQQIVAMVAVQDRSLSELYRLVRQAYPYQNLSLSALLAVVEMLGGKFFQAGEHMPAALRARIAWDPVNERLAALPGSRLLALSNAGTIGDTGAYDVYLADGTTRVGTLDEEFVYETRTGDTFLLGSNVWRVLEVADDRIVVGDAAGATPRMPFWRGDYPWRSYELGVRIGRLRRQIAERLSAAQAADNAAADDAAHLAWLQREYAVDEDSAHTLLAYVGRQLEATGVSASDRTIVVESFRDAAGEPRLVIHSSFGGRVNGAWALALKQLLQERTGSEPETQVNDDGILFRFPQSEHDIPVDVVRQLTSVEASARILAELPASAVFGAHFRMNAARALLLPRTRAGKRTPFWLQRLKARDLLAAVGKLDDFPIVIETYRDCLRDVFDLPHLEQLLDGMQNGSVQVVPIETQVPSPVAAALLFEFISVFMYEWDAPKAERRLQTLSWRSDLLDDLLAEDRLGDLLKPEAVDEVTARDQHLAEGYRARTAEELLLVLQALGDLSPEEAQQRASADAATWLAGLAQAGRVKEFEIPTAHGYERRWVPVEWQATYREVWPSADGDENGPHETWTAAAVRILRRYLAHAGPVTRMQILARYRFPEEWLSETLQDLVAHKAVAAGHFEPSSDKDRQPEQFVDRHSLDRMQRRTLTLLRHEVQPVSLAVYHDFLTRWHHVHPQTQLRGAAGVRQIMAQLTGVELPGMVWERDVLPGRVADYRRRDLADLIQRGEFVWVAAGKEPQSARIRFFGRGQGGLFIEPAGEPDVSASARAPYAFLQDEGASFLPDIAAALEDSPAAIREALVVLVLNGLVTNDTLQALDDLLRFEPGTPAAQPVRSSLAADLATRRRPTAPPAGRRPDAARYRTARRQVAQRLKEESESASWPGRWSLVQRRSVLGPFRGADEQAAQWARILLLRNGVVTREALEREPGAWGQVYPQLQRLELRGEVRRGYFVKGLSGIQYALPEAVEQLRAGSAAGDDSLVVLNATDPAIVGRGDAASEGLSFVRVPSSSVVLYRGRPVLVAEENGERLTTAPGEPFDLIERALTSYLKRPNAPRRVHVALWNGEPSLGSDIQGLLQGLGFQRMPSGLEWWAGP